MTTIKLKNGSGAPTAGDLVQGEPALDLTNKRLYTEDSGGTVIEVGTNPTSITTGTFTSTGIDDNATSTKLTVADTAITTGSIDQLIVTHSTDGGGIRIDSTNSTNTGSIRFGDDLDNYIGALEYNHTNNSMSMYANNATRMTIDSSGKVGINSTSPYRTLTVSGDQVVEGLLEVTAATPQILFSVPSGGLDSRIHNDGSGNFIFGTGTNSATPTERMRIDSSGHIHTGYTSNFGGDHINVLASDGGGISIAQNNAGTATSGTTLGSLSFQTYLNGQTFAEADARISAIAAENQSGSAAGTHLALYTKPNGTGPGSAPSERMRITSAGNVGIGTSSPLSVLTVAVDDATGDNGARIAGVTDGNKQLRLAYNTTGNYANIQAIHAGTAYTNLVLQKDGGNVGIGTSSPSFGLSVESDNGSGYAALFRKSSSDPALTIQTTSSITQIQGLNSALSATNDIAMQVSGGNVGIGTASPANLMHLEGTGVVVGATQLTLEGRYNGYGAGLEFVSRTSSGGTRATMAKITADGEAAWNTTASTQDAGLRFSTTEGGTLSEKVRISASGNVGIGTTSASTILEIQDANAQLTIDSELSTFSRVVHQHNGTSVWTTGTRLASDYHIFRESGSGNVIIDAGNVGIGTTNAPYKLVVSNGGASSIEIEPAYSGTANLVQHYNRSGAAYVDAVNIAGQHRFAIGGTEAVRIDSGGNLLVGCTAKPSASVVGTMISDDLDTEGNKTSTSLTSTATHFVFFNPNGAVGSISTSGSATAFNTSSDQRLKDNIVNAPSASDDIDAIQVRSFDWKADGSHQKYGMVAQELQSVAPEAVTEGDTEEDMMSVDYSKLVPMLVKEIQSLRARVAQLEGAN